MQTTSATTEPDWTHLADRILDTSVVLGDGERLLVAMTSIETYPLAERLIEGAVRRGAFTQLLLRPPITDEAIRVFGTERQAAEPIDMELHGMAWADAYVTLRAMTPPRTDENNPEGYDQRAALLQSAHGQVSAARWQNTRWCIVRFPTVEYAKYLGVPAENLRTDFINASKDGRGWEPWGSIADLLQGAREVQILAEDTDLRFSVAGRRWVLYGGQVNLPDGEVATAPVENTVNGTITFPDPLVYAGRRLDRLRLDFKDGQVVGIDAGEATTFVQQITGSDAGAGRLGEFGIGLNRFLSTWTEDIFFDEKILGTVHVALGRAYPECGGTNQSLIHWDLIKDLRPSPGRPPGTLLIDGKPVLKNGRLRLAPSGASSDEDAN